MNYNIDDSEDGLTFSQKQEILDKEKEIKEGYKLHTIISYYPSFTKGTLMGIFGILCILAAFLETTRVFANRFISEICFLNGRKVMTCILKKLKKEKI